jgi:flavin reductase (DIM6/NTAB) family NADH-FMN oxidoreductase RutF
MKKFHKKAFPLSKIRRFLEPGPIVLVSSAWKKESNVMTMGWHMMMQFSPALFGCYIWDGNHSFEMIRRSKECVINVPTANLIDLVVGIGNTSGRDVEHRCQRSRTWIRPQCCSKSSGGRKPVSRTRTGHLFDEICCGRSFF